MGWSDKLIELAKKAAANENVQNAGKGALAGAAGIAGKGGASKAKEKLAARRQRELAIALASQIGGQFSVGTIVEGTPHYVVWLDGKPIDAFRQ